jgi:hypothetical protein
MARQPYMGLSLLVSSTFHGHTLLRHTTVGRTPLDEWSARRRDLYLTTHNTHNRQTSMLPAGFEPTILVSERPKTHALDRTATGIGKCIIAKSYNMVPQRQGQEIFLLRRTPDRLCVPHNFLYNGSRAFPWEWRGRDVSLATHLHLEPRLKMSGALPPLPLGLHSLYKNTVTSIIS